MKQKRKLTDQETESQNTKSSFRLKEIFEEKNKLSSHSKIHLFFLQHFFNLKEPQRKTGAGNTYTCTLNSNLLQDLNRTKTPAWSARGRQANQQRTQGNPSTGHLWTREQQARMMTSNEAKAEEATAGDKQHQGPSTGKTQPALQQDED
jgi:hypothetical protein